MNSYLCTKCMDNVSKWDNNNSLTCHISWLNNRLDVSKDKSE